MNRKGSLIKGAALAAMLGAGLTVAVPGVGLRTASADTQTDQQRGPRPPDSIWIV